MKIIYNNIIPFKGYIAMNLFGIIFARKKLADKPLAYREKTIRHKQIHTRQYIELAFIFFLVWYALEYIVKLLCTFSFDRAYRSVSLEQEAYNRQEDEQYIDNRKCYSWFKYVFRLV